MNYYKRHLGDYARDTGHLTALEHGIFTLLLDYYYSTEKPIPSDKAHRIARATPEQAEAVLKDFFQLTESGWINARADLEIAAYKAQAETNRAIAVARESKKRERNEHESCSTREPSHKPIAISHKPIKEDSARKRATSLPADFSISERVKAWAAEKGHGSLDAHFEHFVGSCKARGAKYIDWDEALMNAIRGNWAKVGNKPNGVKYESAADRQQRELQEWLAETRSDNVAN